MTGSELRRFVGGPFPNLVPGPSGAGTVRGPFPNLVPAEHRQVAQEAPVIVRLVDLVDPPAGALPGSPPDALAVPAADRLAEPAGGLAPASA